MFTKKGSLAVLRINLRYEYLVVEWQEEVTLPQRIEINLVPATMESWGRVQSLAQNPRIKTSLPLHKRVSSLLTFLQSKWRSQEMRLVSRYIHIRMPRYGGL